MKKLKILFSLAGLFAVFYFANASAMEKNVSSLSKQEKEKAREKLIREEEEFKKSNRFVLDSENKTITFDFAGRKKREVFDERYYDSTKIAEEIFDSEYNIETYEKLTKVIKEMDFSGVKNFNLSYVHYLLEEYLRVIDFKFLEKFTNGNYEIISKCYDAFKRDNSSLILNCCFGNVSVDEETGLFGYSVVFKITNEELANILFANSHLEEVEDLFDKILEFFVAFLDFYKKTNNEESSKETCPIIEFNEELLGELNLSGEYALLHKINLNKVDVKVKKNIKEKILKKFEYKNTNVKENEYIEYKDVKFNGDLEDLYKFYKLIYNQVACNEKLVDDDYFTLFNPQNIKNIIPSSLNSSILLIFYEDKLISQQKKLLKSFKSLKKEDVDYLNSKLGVSVVKQIILTYLENCRI